MLPGLASVYVRCVHADTVGDSVACLLPDPFNSRYGSYLKIICGKQILTFIVNWEGNTRLNSNQVVGKRAASYWENTSLMLKQNLCTGPRQTQSFCISSHKDPMKLEQSVPLFPYSWGWAGSRTDEDSKSVSLESKPSFMYYWSLLVKSSLLLESPVFSPPFTKHP